ncbi:MAG: hypothetical protein M1600_03060 [Firmicutes bacterium]|nr:hypothetical protein [Bacillota bacterium]
MYLDTNVSALYAETNLAATMASFGTTENQIATGNAVDGSPPSSYNGGKKGVNNC